MTTVGVLLAAGGGTRFLGSTHKLLAPFRGKTVVSWAALALVEAGLDECAIVVGATDLSREVSDRLVVLENSDWAEGQATSLVRAIAFATARGHDALVIGLADQPLVPASAWQAVARMTTTPIATASFSGERRPPVRLARSIWSELPQRGDEGARVVMREHPELVTVVACDGEPIDIDTVEDLVE